MRRTRRTRHRTGQGFTVHEGGRAIAAPLCEMLAREIELMPAVRVFLDEIGDYLDERTCGQDHEGALLYQCNRLIARMPPTTADVEIPPFYRARVDTGSYYFEAFAMSDAAARMMLAITWQEHCRQTGAALSWAELADSVSVDEVRLFAGYRDHQELRRCDRELAR